MMTMDRLPKKLDLLKLRTLARALDAQQSRGKILLTDENGRKPLQVELETSGRISTALALMLKQEDRCSKNG